MRQSLHNFIILNTEFITCNAGNVVIYNAELFILNTTFII